MRILLALAAFGFVYPASAFDSYWQMLEALRASHPICKEVMASFVEAADPSAFDEPIRIVRDRETAVAMKLTGASRTDAEAAMSSHRGTILRTVDDTVQKLGCDRAMAKFGVKETKERLTVEKLARFASEHRLPSTVRGDDLPPAYRTGTEADLRLQQLLTHKVLKNSGCEPATLVALVSKTRVERQGAPPFMGDMYKHVEIWTAVCNGEPSEVTVGFTQDARRWYGYTTKIAAKS